MLGNDGDIWMHDYLTISIAKLQKSIFTTDEEGQKADVM